MTDQELGQEIINRLNKLIEDPEVKTLLEQLIHNRVNVSERLADHPTVQVGKVSDGVQDYWQVGLLGLLNGIVGVKPNHWGYIAARYDTDTNEFLHFDLLPLEEAVELKVPPR